MRYPENTFVEDKRMETAIGNGAKILVGPVGVGNWARYHEAAKGS